MIESPPPPPAHGREKHAAFHLAFAALLIFHVLVNVWWLRTDNHVIRVDEESHIKSAGDYYVWLIDGGFDPVERTKGLLRIRSNYPPLSYLAGAVFARVLGYSPDRVTLSCTAMLLLILVGVYRIARTLMPPWHALFAAFTAGMFPLMFGLSRLFNQDIFAAAAAVWAVYALLRSDRFRRPWWVLAFGVLNGLGFLAKQTTFVFLLAPWGLVIVLGFAAALREAPGRGKALGRLAANLAICGAATFAIGGWWYLYHFKDLYQFWTGEHLSGQGALAMTLTPEEEQALAAAAAAAMAIPEDVSAQGPGAAPAPVAPVAAAPAAAEPPAAPAPVAAPVPPPTPPLLMRLWAQFVNRHWSNYPVYLINEALFLPTALAAAAGLTALRRRRFRTLPAAACLLWIVGGYLLMTWLFRTINPRYLIVLLPAFGILCALAFSQIERSGIRRAGMGAFAALLLVQYVQLTVLPLPGLKRIEVPVLREHAAVQWCHNGGLTVIKDFIVTGVYNIHAPIPGPNSVDRIYRAITAREQRRKYEPPDETSRFQVVSLMTAQAGLVLGGIHYGRKGPLTPVDFPDEVLGPFPFAREGEERAKPEEAFADLAQTDYVIMKTGADENSAMRALYWSNAFLNRGYGVIAHFFEPELGKYKANRIHVMARHEEPITLENAAGLFDLAELKLYEGTPYGVPPQDAPLLELRLAKEAAKYAGAALPISDSLALLHVFFTEVVPGWYRLRIFFRVEGPIEEDYRIYVQAAVVDEADAATLPEHLRAGGVYPMNFTPYPRTNEWRAGEYIVVGRDVPSEPIKYRVDLGLYVAGTDRMYGARAGLGVIDFSKLPPEPPRGPERARGAH